MCACLCASVCVHCYIDFMHTDGCDCNNNVTLIGAVVGADCVVIIIMVITNIMVWIYCFRKRHHIGICICIHTCVYIYIYIYIYTFSSTDIQEQLATFTQGMVSQGSYKYMDHLLALNSCTKYILLHLLLLTTYVCM